MKRRRILKISVGPKVYAYLEQLVATGLFGWTPTDAAERLLCQQLSQILGQTPLVDIGKEPK